jgi:signal peptidase
MHRAVQAIAIVTQACLWAVLIGFVALGVVPRLTPFDILIVRGGSMEPEIHVGSVIVIDRDAADPGIGSVVSFRARTGEIITHRVVAIDEGRYVTRGDANQTRDLDERTADQVVGTVLFSVPFVGYALHVLQQPIVFLLLLLSTGGMLIVHELVVIAREIARMRRRGVVDER